MNRFLKAALLVVLINILSVTLYSIDGPAQAEYAQFEPVDASDLVNLQTGDLSYVIPLLDVPGPEGGYPIVLSYHAGIGTNQDASWVGLGWSVNPGAINRFISCFPDDYKGNRVQGRIDAEIEGSFVGIGFGWGPFGMDMTFHSNSAFGPTVVNAYVDLAKCVPGAVTSDYQTPWSAKVGVSSATGVYAEVGYSYTFSDYFKMGPHVGWSESKGFYAGAEAVFGDNRIDGASIFPGATIGWETSKQGVQYTASGSVFGRYNGDIVPLVGFGIDSGGGSSASIAGATIGLATVSAGGSWKYSQTGIGAKIPLGHGFWISFKIGNEKLTMHSAWDEASYGYLYQQAYFNDRDGRVEDRGVKFERNKAGDYLFTSPDSYQISCQGISGTFEPLSRHPFYLTDFTDPEDAANLYHEPTNNFNAQWLDGLTWNTTSNALESDIVFRFTGDTGSNFVQTDDNFTPYSGSTYLHDYENMYDSTSNNYRYGARIIDPLFETTYGTGKLLGFIVTNIDGTVYEFTTPVITKMSASKVEDDEGDDTYCNVNVFPTPYATQWLITQIKGPDWVDRDNSDSCSDDDWGYWVKFNYDEDEDNTMIWTSYSPGASDREAEQLSCGVRQRVYLQSIETATHIAEFEQSGRRKWHMSYDDMNDNLFLKISSASIEYDQNNNPYAELRVIGNWIDPLTTLVEEGEPDHLVLTYDAKYRRLVEGEYWYHTINKVVYVGNLDDPQLIEYAYDASTDETIFRDHTIQSTSDSYNLYETIGRKFILNGMYLNRSVLAKQLNRITLYNKTNLSAQIKAVGFTYDRSLAPFNCFYDVYTRETVTRGKLTLKELAFYGMKDANGNDSQVLPAYHFAYRFNPKWGYLCQDRWGNYKEQFETSTVFDAMTSQDKTEADEASAWSLTDVLTPNGALLSFEYESDDYYYVEDVPELNTGEYCGVASISDSTITLGSTSNLGIAAGDEVCLYHFFATSEPFMQYHRILTVLNVVSVNGLDICVDSPVVLVPGDMYLLQKPANQTYGGGIRTKSVTVHSDGEYHYTEYDYNLEDGKSSGVTGSLPPQFRTHRYALEELYDDEDYRNFLNEEHVPDTYHQNDDLDKLISKYPDDEFSAFRPPAGVMYSRVEVTERDEEDSSINGSIVYEHYTGHDYPTDIQVDEPNHTIEITDYSLIHGRLKKRELLEHYWQYGVPHKRPVEVYTCQYAFSTDFADGSAGTDGIEFVTKATGSPGYETITDIDTKLPGFVSKNYVFKNNEPSVNVNMWVEHNTANCYLVSEFTDSYSYSDNSAAYCETTHQETGSIAFDALTGQPLASISTDSKFDQTVHYSEPAYWLYDDMFQKNMLSQTYLTGAARFDYPYQGSNILGLADEISYSSLFSSTTDAHTTRWANDWETDNYTSSDVWRMDDEYVFIGEAGQFIPLHQCQQSATEGFYSYTFPGESNPTLLWKRVQDIVSYNRYSKIAEMLGGPGSPPSCVIYGYQDALPIAIVQNSSLDEVYHTSFEDGLQDWAGIGIAVDTLNLNANQCKTGNSVLEVGDSSTYGYCARINLGSLPSGKYTISCWHKAVMQNTTAGISLEPALHYPLEPELMSSTSQWQYLEKSVEVTTTNDQYLYLCCPPNSSYTLYDEIRVLPVDSSMSTYAYDRLTNNLTSITDANNGTMYFEYDLTGRLKLIRDFEGNILSSQTMTFGLDACNQQGGE